MQQLLRSCLVLEAVRRLAFLVVEGEDSLVGVEAAEDLGGDDVVCYSCKKIAQALK